MRAAVAHRSGSCLDGRGSVVQVAECTLKAVDADAARWAQPTMRMRSEARAKRFSMRAEELIEKVGTGQMHDADARSELRRLFTSVEAVHGAWANLPPAFVYRCIK